MPGAIQTSVPINPGNSGGALVSTSGEVIAIPTLAAVSPQGGAQALAAAQPGQQVPVAIVRGVAAGPASDAPGSTPAAGQHLTVQVRLGELPGS